MNLAGRHDLPAECRFELQHVPEPTSGCWLWLGGLSGNGYGRFIVGGRTVQAHRYAYERAVGSIPDGMTLDHRCRTRCCVNPAHLEPVTSQENTLRGDGPAARHARKTACPRGHAYDEANTRVYRGKRYCRTCERERSKTSRADYLRRWREARRTP